MILTVTPNAAIDKTLRVANLQIGRRHRCEPGAIRAGGKGINVARALRALSEPVIATGLAGGRTGELIVDDLTSSGIVSQFVQIADESRVTTIFIVPAGEGTETEVIEYGPEVSDGELASLEQTLTYLYRGASAVVLAGSLPRHVPDDWYARTIREARKARVFTVLDSEGEALRLGVAGEPDLVMPNQEEAEALVGFEFETTEDIVIGLETIAELGARSVVITRNDGAYVLAREAGKTHVLRATIPPLDVVSSVGSGDALTAGFLAARRAERPLPQVLRHAVACGAASTQELVPGALDPKEVSRLIGSVEIEELAPTAA